jgi:addiction module RelE/StbE family toxin
MSQPRIRWTKRALRRLDEVGAHIDKDDPAAAARVVARLVSAVEKLAEYPAMGRVGRIKNTRELVLADVPYIIPYRASRSTIEITTVMHTSQRWPSQM